ncbi:MAG TPA: hypothetical protein VMT35_08915 [Ignavibacteriaceae bacterium]|nr:hypothetical protein [Ignavibacteriaceae bacterium]
MVLILPIKLPYTFNVPGKVLAAEELLVTRNRNGQLLTILRNNITGTSESFSVLEFERGDNAKFYINPRITMGCIISKYDTIGSIYSNELEYSLTSLKGELNVAQSLLNQSITGEKESLIKEAKENLDLAIKKTELEKKLFYRAQQLHEKGLISDQEFELSQNTLGLDETAEKVAEAKLQTVLTGEKKEQIEMVKSQIAALQKQVIILEKKSAGFNLLSPIKGFVRWVPDGDTLLIISDTSSYVISFPVPLVKKNYIDSKTCIKIIPPSGEEDITAESKRIDGSIEYLSLKPVVLGQAVIKGFQSNFMPGLMVECKVECGSIPISEHINRIFKAELF